MPKYINGLSNPIYFNGTVFVPNQEVETYNTLDTKAFAVGTIAETYNIVAGNKVLKLKFNDETSWTTVTLTEGGAQTSADVVADIEAIYPGVAFDEDGKVRIEAPFTSNVLSSVYVATTGSTAAATLGLSTDNVNPLSAVALQAFKISANAGTYNVASNNNTFVFKMNNSLNWITATLTIGAARTAAQVASDINSAYETATADASKVALAVTIDAGGYVKLIAPVYNNFQSKLYIKSTGNTALSLLGFSGDNFSPISQSLYPSLVKTSELPLYNPIISETVVTFAVAGTQHYYLTDPEACKTLQLVRVSGGGGISFTVYLEDVTNTPPFTLVVLEAFTVDLSNIRISKLVIVSNGIGTITVRELNS